jgi:hypothetical protein
MRWCAALAVVLVALVVMTVRTIRRPHRHPPPVDPEPAELAPPPPAPSGTSFSPTEARRESSGIAHLRGRVLFPGGGRPNDDTIDVVAEDGTRKVSAQLDEEGRFQLHLPSGRYTLVASAGALVGVVPDVLARAGATHDVDIRLSAGVAIEGKLRTPGGVVDVSASLVGQDDDEGVPRVDDGSFHIEGLIPGRRYTLTFRGPGVRRLILAGVTAPAHGLDVELQARAEINGAIGFARGTPCPISDVELQIGGKTVRDENDDEVSATVGPDCSFLLAVPDQATAVTVVATGDGWHLEEHVAVPPTGDPEPICLNPPCRSDPREGLAHLRITLEGADADALMSADVEPVSAADRSTHFCGGTGGRCDVEGLIPGATFKIKARGAGCVADPIKVTVVAGDNKVRLPCHRQKQIEGVLRTPGGEPPGPVIVRCPDGTNDHLVFGSRVFGIVCKGDATAIEYQLAESGIWRRAPIASAADPAFVDIAL